MSKECVNCTMNGNIYICRNCVYYFKRKLVTNYKPKYNPLKNNVVYCSTLGRMEIK